MTAQTFRTDKLIKELEQLYERRVEAEEEMERLDRNADYTGAQYQEGVASGIRRAIYNICNGFGLTDTDIWEKNKPLVRRTD